MEQRQAAQFAGVFQLFRESVSIYKKRFWVFVRLLVGPTLLTYVPELVQPETNPFWIAAGFLWFLFTIVLWLLVHLAILCAIQDSTLGARQAILTALRRILPFLWVSAIKNVVVLLGLLFFIIPGIIFSLWYALTSFVFVDEGKRGWEAFKRSKELMAKMWVPVIWRFFALIPLLFLGAVGSALPELLPARLALGAGIISTAFSMALYPFFFVYGFQVYYQIKKSKEPDVR
ncbi:MAG: hypothetical protein Q8P39_03925 [Candidatus Yanofskybacteria bacterium]|nr:hypothetical protein [Candidatus Yanofskybacteria bacterium]